MKSMIDAFTKDESGAVTVDWVILTAAVVVLASGFMLGIHNSTAAVSSSVGVVIDAQNATPTPPTP